MKKYPLVLIRWNDVISDKGIVWKDEDEVDEWITTEDWETYQTGYLIRDEKTFIVLANMWAKQHNQFSMLCKIPRLLVKEMTILYEKDKPEPYNQIAPYPEELNKESK